jgi:hypothetical protein
LEEDTSLNQYLIRIHVDAGPSEKGATFQVELPTNHGNCSMRLESNILEQRPTMTLYGSHIKEALDFQIVGH